MSNTVRNMDMAKRCRIGEEICRDLAYVHTTERAKRYLNWTDAHIIGEDLGTLYLYHGDLDEVASLADAYAGAYGMISRADDIATYMDDDIREELHSYYDDDRSFLSEYLNRDPELWNIIRNEFPDSYKELIERR